MPNWNIKQASGLEKIHDIKWIVLDVDGVLTDGTVFISDAGIEMKGFNVQDGQGIKMWQRAGFGVAIITGRSSLTVAHRAKDLGIEYLYQGAKNKLEVFHKFLQDSSAKASEVCFMGDDLVELPVFREISLAVAVANAVEEVKLVAGLVTIKTGGDGAVREITDFFLKQKGLWDLATARYYENQ